MNLDDGNNPIIEELMKQLQESGFKDEGALKDMIEHLIEKANRTPVPEMGGLSPDQVHSLGLRPFDTPDVLQFHPERIDPLETTVITLFRGIAEACGEKGLKGTPSGFLPRKLVKAMLLKIAGNGAYWKDGKFWVHNEDEFPELIMVRHCATWAGFLRKLHGKFLLTKKGKKLLAEQAYGTIYYEMFRQACLKWNWGCMDGYEDFHIIRVSFSISLRFVQKDGHKLRDPKEHYGKRILQAFPQLVDEAAEAGSRWDGITPEKYVVNAYAVRMFRRFAIPFGLVDYEPKSPDTWVEHADDKLLVKRSELFDKFVEFRV